MNIVYDYVPESSPKRTGRKMAAQSLTIHSTANPASTARNERDYLTNPSNTSSAAYHRRSASAASPFRRSPITPGTEPTARATPPPSGWRSASRATGSGRYNTPPGWPPGF